MAVITHIPHGAFRRLTLYGKPDPDAGDELPEVAHSFGWITHGMVVCEHCVGRREWRRGDLEPVLSGTCDRCGATFGP